MDLEIRSAVFQDAEALSELITQLGYPVAVDQMEARLAEILRQANAHQFVGVFEGKVCGFIALEIGLSYTQDGHQGRIVAMVVHDDFRGKGIGSRLLECVELEAFRHGVKRLVVTSASHRSDTHRFYQDRGYSETGKRFAKQLYGLDKSPGPKPN